MAKGKGPAKNNSKPQVPVNQQAKTVQNESNETIIDVIILSVLMFIIFYAPFFRGLFFNQEMSTTFFITGLLFLAYLIRKILSKSFEFFKSPLDIAAVILVFAYFLPILYPASAQGAWDKALRYTNYLFIFIICRGFARKEKNIRLILDAVMLSAVGVCVLGIDAGAGSHINNSLNWLYAQIPVWLHMNSGLTSLVSFNFFGGFAEGRVYSTLQYPNVLASYLTAVFILGIGLLMTTNKLWKGMCLGGINFLIFYTVVLTSSRGMFAIFPIVLMLLFIAFRKKEYILDFIVESSVPIILGAVFASTYSSFSASGQYGKVWLFIALGLALSAGMTALVGIIKKNMEERRNEYVGKVTSAKSMKAYAGIISSVIVGALVLLLIGLQIETPLVIKHSPTENDFAKNVVRDLTDIKPSTKYILDLDVDSKTDKANKEGYSMHIISYDRFVNAEILASLTGKTEKGKKSVEFTTKSDTMSVRLQFTNTISGTSVAFSNLQLRDMTTTKSKRLIVQYKFLPTELVYKIKDINLKTHNAWERFIFVQDAFKIIKDHPFGIGGNGWRAIYHKYQSYPYASNEVHNYPVQLFVETGVIGILALIFMGGMVVHHFVMIRKEKDVGDNNGIIISSIVFAAIGSLYAHSIIDFDFSLSAIPILAWALMGIIAGLYSLSPNKIKFKMPKSAGYIINLFVLVMGLMLIIAGFNSLYGRYLLGQVSAVEKQFSGQVTKEVAAKAIPGLVAEYRRYLNYQPLDQEKRKRFIEYLNIYNSIKGDKPEYIQELIKNVEANVSNEPYSLEALMMAASLNIAKGDYDLALKYADRTVESAPFISSVYKAKADIYMMAAESKYKNKDVKSAKKYYGMIKDIKAEFEANSKKSMKPIAYPQGLDEAITQAETMLLYLNSKE